MPYKKPSFRGLVCLPRLSVLRLIYLGQMEDLVPLNGCLLVELTEALKIVATPDKPYSTHSSGVVRVAEGHDDLLGKEIFFEEYKDGCQTNIDGKDYAFIKYEDVRGFRK